MLKRGSLEPLFYWLFMTNNYTKIAQVTFVFWVLKIIATTLGETLGDFISMSLNLGYLTGTMITFSALFVILLMQIRADKYYSWLFWLAIIGTTTAGTEISDFMDRSLHLGYIGGSILLSTLLLIALFIWHRIEGNISVNAISNKRTEIFFWCAVLISNSLGTAFGDYLVDDLGLSYIAGAMATSAIIVVVLALHYFTKINETILFWVAFIFTRPFGATFGDFLTKPLESGGLNLPRDYASIAAVMLFILILYFSENYKKRAVR